MNVGQTEWKCAWLGAGLRAGREGRSSPWRTAAKSISHPSLGPITLDCDTLLLPDSSQTMLVYSAEPGSPEATALDLLRVTGLQHF